MQNQPTDQASLEQQHLLASGAIRGLAAATSDTNEVWQDAKGDSREGTGSSRRGSVSEGLSHTAARPGDGTGSRGEPGAAVRKEKSEGRR